MQTEMERHTGRQIDRPANRQMEISTKTNA